MQLAIDGWRVDPASREARRGDQVEQLSPRAIRLLQVLGEADGAVLSRADLLERVWPNVFVSDESLTQVVSELRRKLGNRELITTVARGGYRLTQSLLQVADPQSAAIAQAPFTIDAYALCIEAKECFQSGVEGSQRAFVDLAAEAAAMSPDYAGARALHALALLKRHIFWSEGHMLLETALDETTTALKLDPQLAGAHLTDAAIRVAIGMTDLGLRSLERAIAFAPEDPLMHLEAAILVLSMGNRKAAGALAVKSAQLAPHDFGADLLAARIYQYSDPVRGRLHAQRALRKVQAELDMNPQSMRALYALGPLLAQLGDHRAARSALEGVAHHNSPLEYYRAIGFAQIGDGTAALERLDFLGLRGWRHACILDKDDGFRPLQADNRLHRLQADIMAA